MNIKEETISRNAECIEYEQFTTWSSFTLTDRKTYETSQYTQHANV